MKYKLGLLAVILWSIFAPTTALALTAADSGDLRLTISPLPVSLSGKPGQKIVAKLSVKNSGTKTENLKVDLMKFSAYGEEGKPLLRERSSGDNYFDWVSFSQNRFLAEPDVWHDITMTITLPKEAALGYYYAVTFSRLNPPASTKSNKLQGGTAILVLVDALAPTAKKEIKIDEFTSSHRIYEFLPTSFKIKLHNTGNIHLASSGNIFIKRGSKVIGNLEVNQEAGNILPGTKRIFNAQWADGFPVYIPKTENGVTVLKDGKTVNKLQWDISKLGRLRFGYYTANLVMTYDDGKHDVPLEAVVGFWVIPWRLIAAVFVPLSGVAFLIYKYIRLKARMKKLQSKEPK